MGLFDAFSPQLPQQWRSLIEKELKDRDYSALCFNTPEGVALQPDIALRLGHQPEYESAGAAVPFNPDWGGEEYLEDAVCTDARLQEAAASGMAALSLSPKAFTQHAQLLGHLGLRVHLTGLPIEVTPLLNMRGALCFDPLTAAAPTGSLLPETGLFDALVPAAAQLSGFTHVFANGSCLHNAGADALTELAVCLSLLHEARCHDGLRDAGYAVSLSAGRDFFTQVAKFRAMRLLWARLLEAHQSKGFCALSIHGHTSLFYAAAADIHNNLLRTTTQALSAIWGGADFVRIYPYDVSAAHPTDQAARLARNLHALLRYESLMNKVADPLRGSALTEMLTLQFAEKAWTRFREIEAEGGVIPYYNSGKLAVQIASDRANLSPHHSKVLGVNLYPNPQEPPALSAPLPEAPHARGFVGMRWSDHLIAAK
jgi:hypothetical protein